MATDRPLTLLQQRFVEALPTAHSLTDAAIKAGYTQSPGGSASGMASENLKKPQVIAAIQEQQIQKALANQAHIAAAQALFIANTAQISQAMVTRATGEGRDSQRAGERILETVGVLQKEPLIVVSDPTKDLLAELQKLTALAMGQLVTVEEPVSLEAEVNEVFGIKESDAI